MKKTLLQRYAMHLMKVCGIFVMMFMMKTTTNAQSVEYAIKWAHSYDLGDTLTVYMKSNTSYTFPLNQVSTGQVTLRIPTGMLAAFDGTGTVATDGTILIGQSNGTWSNNARFDIGDATSSGVHGTHEDGNDYDYISFGLTNLGTRDIEFVAGEELPLFSFPFSGTCTDDIPIRILDHVEDTTFMANGITSPNNNLSVLGAGGDIYGGNYYDFGARCYDFDNDDVNNPDDICDYTLEDDIPGVDANGCTDADGDGFFPDDNPTADDSDYTGSGSPDEVSTTVTETYNQFDPDESEVCIPQGDSLRTELAIYDDAWTDFTNGNTDICAGDPVYIILDMIEFESTTEANVPASPVEYDERSSHTVVLNSSLGGNFTVTNYADGDTITRYPTEDGTVFTLVSVLDNFSCSALELSNDGTINVNDGAGSAVMFGDATLCDGESTDIFVSIIGGISPYTLVYTDDGGTTTYTEVGYVSDQLISVTPPTSATTTYTIVSLTDASADACPTDPANLTGDATVTVQEQPVVAASTVTQPTSCGAADGTITVNVTNIGSLTGTVEYSIDAGINWQTNNVFNGLGSDGTFNVAVRVDAACMVLDTTSGAIAIAASQAPVYAGVNATDPTQCGTDDGSITVLIQSSGPSPDEIIRYRIDAGAWQTTNSFTGLSDGAYTVEVQYFDTLTSDQSCTIAFPGGATIDPISGPSFVIQPTPGNSSDCGESDGSISVSASAGSTGGVEYRLETGLGAQVVDWGTQNSFSSLAADDYVVYIRNNDAGGSCPDTSSTLTITEPGGITFNSQAIDSIQNCGVDNGQIVVSATGDLAQALQYSIDNGATWQASGTFAGLSSGTYNVAVRNDADGSCETPSGVAAVITAPEEILLADADFVQITDCDLTDGEISVTISDYDENLTLEYSLVSGSGLNDVTQPGPNFTGLPADTYTLNVNYTTANCLETFVPIDIDSVDRPDVTNVVATDPVDCGVEDGEIQVIATSGAGALQYSFDAGTTWGNNNVLSGLGTTTVDVRVRNADGTCDTDAGQASITIPDFTVIDAGTVTVGPATACGVDDATITVGALTSGNNPEYSIDGTTFQPGNIFSSLGGGTYLVTVRNSATPSCEDTLSAIVPANTAPEMVAKVFLQGPYNTGTGLMNDDLRELEVIPIVNPYILASLESYGADTTQLVAGHVDEVASVNDASNLDGVSIPVDTANTDIFADKGSNSIVDWIAVELRDDNDSSSIVSRRVVFVQRDGDIVEWSDGETGVKFQGTCASETEQYYVSVKHRNHLGVMTADPVDFSAGEVNLDFTDGSLNLYRKFAGLEPQSTIGGVKALWGGNVAFNRRVLFQGNLDDAGLIGKKVTEHGDNDTNLANFILKGYYNTDVNMDGTTIFQGAPNDVDILFFNIMGNPANENFNANFILAEQLPGDGQ